MSIAIVTGASRGLGRALARGLARRGWSLVIDARDVITSGANFTKSAQSRNAENVLLIKDSPALARAYAENWQRRAAVARPLHDFRERLPHTRTGP